MSFAQATFFQIHIANGRPDLALIVMLFPASAFAEMDALLEAAWLAGAADAARKD
ncbi:hypothetical protein ACFSDD_11045 [Salipiger marinus]|uniref:hypothetical protein n=1 Tax=Salipiger marinus TaxID=555512 RepID=UPI001E3B4494|nr:hypothetical protein [Salipiger manganoxidans]MCD1619135.1 hypothetical protein [Salipiger manganoxidans]MEB3419907.1 hypothetical protein [Salipiger manganoxidans]